MSSTSSSEVDRDDLTSKLTLYSDQLVQVKTLLSSDPENTQYLKLKDDLLNVINLTTALLSQHQTSEEDVDAESQGNEAAKGAGDDFDDDDDFEKEVTTTTQQPTGAIQIGECVEVVGGDRAFAGVVTNILSPSEYRVKYFEFDTEVTLPIATLTRINTGNNLTKADIKPGFKGQCKYSQDQLYYDATVQQVTEHGAIVVYTQYGNTEEVPIAYIRPLIQKQKKSDKEGTLIKIPDNLKILPTDTEEVSLLAYTFTRLHILVHAYICYVVVVYACYI